MKDFFSKKLFILLGIVTIIVITIVSGLRLYFNYSDYQVGLERDANAKAVRIAAFLRPSIWNIYKKSVNRKFSKEFSSEILDSELRNSNVSSIVVKGRFGHFYMGKQKNSDGEIVEFKDEKIVKENFFASKVHYYPIKHGTMTVGGLEIIFDNSQFYKNFKKNVFWSIFEVISLSIFFFFLTYLAIRFVLFKLLERMSLANKIFEVMAEGVVELDSRMNVLSLNHAAENLMGVTGVEVKGNSVKEFFNDIDFESYMEKGSLDHLVTFESVLVTAKSRIPVKISFMPVYGINKKFLSYVLKFEDISEQKKLYNDILDAKNLAEQANERKGEYLANMSHELRTPLNAVIGFCQVLEDEDLSGRSVELVSRISSASTSLLGVINDVIDYSKIEARKFSLEEVGFDLKEKLQTAFNLLEYMAAEKKLNYVFDYKLEHDCYVGDSQKIFQIINNLLSNSLKFTQNGRVILRVELEDSKGEADLIKISVIDNGVGIKDEAKLRIFDPFTQADNSTTRTHGGSGLGLSITKSFVELMEDGTIKITDNPEGGAVFSVTIRMKRFFDEVSSVKDTEFKENTEPVDVLIVDDDASNRKVLDLFLRKVDYVTTSFSEDGQNAFESYKKKPVGVILLDMHMPRLDGLGATVKIREYEKQAGLKPCRIIIISANTLENNIDMLIKKGADSYLFKPISKKALLKEISKR